jgi:cytidylate kinase
MNRKTAPLKPASDAIIIDTTTLDISQVMNEVMQLVDQRVRLS